MKIKVPQIRFFYRGPCENLMGYASRNQGIHIAADLGDRDIVRVVLHESRHCWQFEQPDWVNRSDRIKELDARLFEMEWPR